MSDSDNTARIKNRTNDGAYFIYHTPDWLDVCADLSAQEGWPEVERLLGEKRFTVKDTDITYRLLNHWSEAGLLDDSRENDSGWRKLSVKDIVWLRLLRDLREFGMSLDALRNTYNSLQPHISPEFEAALALCFRKPSTPVFVVVFSNGIADVATLHSLRATDYMVGYEVPYVRINLNALCGEILGTSNLMPPREMWLSLADQERQLVLSSREQDIDELRVSLKSGDIQDIEKTSKLQNVEKISDLMNDIDYGEIKLKFESGKIRAAQKTKRKRVKK